MISKIFFVCFIAISTCVAAVLKESSTIVEAISCPSGYFCVADDRTKTVVPQACSPGTFSGIGASTCTACVIGYWTVRPGLSYCDEQETPVKCEAGKFSRAGTISCTRCAAGEFTTLTGSTYCDICGPGHYCPNPDEEPIPCLPGFAQSNSGQVICNKCPTGSYADKSGMAYCIPCPSGMICP